MRILPVIIIATLTSGCVSSRSFNENIIDGNYLQTTIERLKTEEGKPENINIYVDTKAATWVGGLAGGEEMFNARKITMRSVNV